MKKLMCIIALAAIGLGTVEAAIPVKMQQDTAKTMKKTKVKRHKMKTKMTKTKKDTSKA